MIISQGSARRPGALLILLLLALAAPASRAMAQGQPQTVSALAPGDILKVEVWQEKDVSGEFLVSPDGTATLPLVGEQRVVGYSREDLRARLLAEYLRYLRNPSISLTPLRRVQVLGEVNTPGVYVVDPTVSLSGAIAMAGGASSNGDVRKIRILRDGRVFQPSVGASMTLRDVDIRSGDQIVVAQKPWFVRNSTFIVSVLIGLPTTVLAIVNAL